MPLPPVIVKSVAKLAKKNLDRQSTRGRNIAIKQEVTSVDIGVASPHSRSERAARRKAKIPASSKVVVESLSSPGNTMSSTSREERASKRRRLSAKSDTTLAVEKDRKLPSGKRAIQEVQALLGYAPKSKTPGASKSLGGGGVVTNPPPKKMYPPSEKTDPPFKKTNPDRSAPAKKKNESTATSNSPVQGTTEETCQTSTVEMLSVAATAPVEATYKSLLRRVRSLRGKR